MTTQSQKKPSEVFLPKSPVPGGNIIDRLQLQKDFQGNLEVSWKQIMITWISGSWKSWLYKICIKDQYESIDLAEIGSNTKFNITTLVDRKTKPTKTSYSETKNAEVGVSLAKWWLSHTWNYTIVDQDWLIKMLEYAKERGKKFIVLENLENIKEREDILLDIKDHIISSDSDNYIPFDGFKLIIVATQRWADKFWEMVQKWDSKTVRSRIEQIKVDSMTEDEIKKYVNNWFNQCGIEIQYDELIKEISWSTWWIANEIADLCLKIWIQAVESWYKVDETVFKCGKDVWIKSLYHIQATNIYGMMNARDSKQRRNQVLYVLWTMNNNDFRTSEVTSKLKSEFPLVNWNIQLTQVLDTLVERQLLRKSIISGTNVYAFEDPVNRFVIRNTLSKSKDWLVTFNLDL